MKNITIDDCRDAVIKSFGLVMDQAKCLNMEDVNLEGVSIINAKLSKASFTELAYMIDYIGDVLCCVIGAEMHNTGFSNDEIEKAIIEWASPLTPDIVNNINALAFRDSFPG